MFELEKEFYELVKLFDKSNYTIMTINNSDYLYGYNVKNTEMLNIGFCTLGGCGVYSQLNGMIGIYKGLFDHWTNCVINLPLPENNSQRKFLMRMVDYWGPKDRQFMNGHRHKIVESYDYSNAYGLK